jgi:hypothetical protein
MSGYNLRAYVSPSDPNFLQRQTPLYYRCPRGCRPWMDLETCQSRKDRKYHGCVSCKVPAQKRREARIKAKAKRR